VLQNTNCLGQKKGGYVADIQPIALLIDAMSLGCAHFC